MRLLEVTLETPEENLALDEALLEEAESARHPVETLRLWESPAPFVVVGRNSEVAREVNLGYCRERSIQVLRRSSGGASVVVAPGSLMYAVVLCYEKRPHLRALDEAHRFVLTRLVDALGRLAPDLSRQGTSDLAIGSMKCSGNSLRCKRNCFLYHGTLLYGAPLDLIADCLAMPPRQPEYRASRPHRAFLTNLPATADQLRIALAAGWQATASNDDWPRERVKQLVATRYSQAAWNEAR
jgi:lipoate-protein ligase A